MGGWKEKEKERGLEKTKKQKHGKQANLSFDAIILFQQLVASPAQEEMYK